MSEVKFLRESRHPNIVLFMGVSFNPYCIVTELLDTSLFDVIHVQKRRLTPQQQQHIALGIARGLASLHGHQIPIVHRDMKSLNSQTNKQATQRHATHARSPSSAAVCTPTNCLAFCCSLLVAVQFWCPMIWLRSRSAIWAWLN